MMTSWLITHDTRWRAALAGAPVTSLLGVATMSDVDAYAPALLRGNPWADPAVMSRTLEESPLTYADRVKTPTLIVTDAGDQRVPTPLSYEFYHAVRATGTPAELLVYPVNGHFPSDPLHATPRASKMEALETEVGTLREELRQLREEFAAFRKQFE